MGFGLTDDQKFRAVLILDLIDAVTYIGLLFFSVRNTIRYLIR